MNVISTACTKQWSPKPNTKILNDHVATVTGQRTDAFKDESAYIQELIDEFEGSWFYPRNLGDGYDLIGSYVFFDLVDCTENCLEHFECVTHNYCSLSIIIKLKKVCDVGEPDESGEANLSFLAPLLPAH